MSIGNGAIIHFLSRSSACSPLSLDDTFITVPRRIAPGEVFTSEKKLFFSLDQRTFRDFRSLPSLHFEVNVDLLAHGLLDNTIHPTFEVPRLTPLFSCSFVRVALSLSVIHSRSPSFRSCSIPILPPLSFSPKIDTLVISLLMFLGKEWTTSSISP